MHYLYSERYLADSNLGVRQLLDACRQWEQVQANSSEDSKTEAVDSELEGVPQSPALDALRANGRLVKLLTGWRWSTMQDAIEAGGTWQEIGDALGMSRHAAHDFYALHVGRQQRVADQDKLAFDADRAREAISRP